MINDVLRFYLKLLFFALTIGCIHYTLHSLGFWSLSIIEFKRIHGFNFLASLFFHPILAYAFHFIKDKAGFVFLSLSLFKMLLAMIFMAILILPNKDELQSFALQFLVVYSIYLVFELRITVRKLSE
jgi:magnesium-transporting ATPase (P-type)